MELQGSPRSVTPREPNAAVVPRIGKWANLSFLVVICDITVKFYVKSAIPRDLFMTFPIWMDVKSRGGERIRENAGPILGIWGLFLYLFDIKDCCFARQSQELRHRLGRLSLPPSFCRHLLLGML